MIGPGRLVNNRLRASFSLVLFFTKRVLNPLVVKDRLLRAGSKKASPEWKKLQAASFKLDNLSRI